MHLALRARSLKAKLSPLVGIIVALGTALVLWYGGRLVVGGTLSAGSLVVFIWYLGKMYKPMQDFAKMTDAFTKAAVGYERIREVMETPPDGPGPPGGPAGSAASRRNRVRKRELQLRGRSSGSDGVTLKAEAGQMTALVGPTGSGKTTIAA